MSLTNIVAIDGEAVEFEWTILGFSPLQNHQGIQSDMRKRNMGNSKQGSSSCEYSTILIGQRKETMRFVFRIQKSQGIRENLLAKTLDVSRSSRRIELEWNSSSHMWKKMRLYSHSNDAGNQCKRSIDSTRREDGFCISSGRRYSKIVRKRPRIPRTHYKAVTNGKEWRSQWRTTRRRRVSTDRIRRWSWSLVRFLVGSRWLHLSSSKRT